MFTLSDPLYLFLFFFLNDPPTTDIYPLPLPDALPIFPCHKAWKAAPFFACVAFSSKASSLVATSPRGVARRCAMLGVESSVASGRSAGQASMLVGEIGRAHV